MITDTEREGKPSASGYDPDSKCPGRHLAQQGLPEEPTAYSEEGDRIHAWLAWRCRGQVGAEPELSEEERETADRCIRQAEEILGEPLGPLTATYVEERFWFYRGAEKMFSGRFDLVPLRQHEDGSMEATVFDWKAGRVRVPHARENMQLRAGAVLVQAHHPRVTKVRVAIIQPWCGPPTVCEYDEAALVQARAELIQHIVRVTTPDQPRIPGEMQCRYCLAKGTDRCPESIQAVQQVAALALPDGRAGEVVDGSRVAGWLDACATAGKIIEAVKRRALHMAQAGMEIPGYVLEPGDEKREVTDSAGAYGAVSSLITAEAFAACAKVGITKLSDTFAKVRQEQAVAAGEKKPTKKVLIEELNGILAPFITTKQNAPSLVRTSEK